MINHSNKTLIVITGPTASGKTSLAVDLALKLNTVIVSADSRQFYKEMKIGTAVPDNETLDKVKHYFICNKSVQDRFDIYRYEKECVTLLNQLFQNNDYVILCGGSVLYIDAVVYGIDELPDPDPEYRKMLQQKIDNGKINELLAELKEIDPEYYDIVDKSNPVRVMRGLEVYRVSGKKFSELRTGKDKQRKFNIIKFYIDIPREEIYDRINKRVDVMMDEGLLNEAKDVIKYRGLTSMKTVGYRELFDFFDGKWSLEKAVSEIKKNTRRYAKRQMTWIRRDGKYIPVNNDVNDILSHLYKL